MTMRLVDRYIEFAQRSRRKGFTMPIVLTPDEATRLSVEIADALCGLSESEKLLFLSNIVELREALVKRSEVLQDEMEKNREELARLTRTLFACNAYTFAATHGTRARVVSMPPSVRPCQ